MLSGVGCPSAVPNPVAGPGEPTDAPLPVDKDGDGWPSSEDCDDGDASSFPAAVEICDGRDNNCDGEIGNDEADLDHDGYLACADDCDDHDAELHPGDLDGDGRSPCAGDCDDADPTRGPDNTPEADACDGHDADCIPDPAEEDGDGDGVLPCGGDCRDDEPAVHAGAEEVCDGLDNDCNGTRDDVPHIGVFPTADANLEDVAWATLVGEETWDLAGKHVALPGDVNGDGYGDLLVATSVVVNASPPGRPSRVYLVYGPVCGEVSLALEPLGVSGAVIRVESDLHALGDVNGDGFDDLGIGGAIFFGPVHGEFTMADADVWFTNLGVSLGRKQVRFGQDWNGDGIGDLLVGDDTGPQADPFVYGPGRIGIFFGPIGSGPHDVDNPDVTIVGDSGGWGWAVATPGDLNGDGADDLVLGSRMGHRVFVLHGPFTEDRALPGGAQATITHSEGADTNFGVDLEGLGDTDGDGQVEFAVGTDDSRMYWFQEAAGELDEAAAFFAYGRKALTGSGSTLAGGADLDGDGRPDPVAVVEDAPIDPASVRIWTAAGVEFSGMGGVTVVRATGDMTGDELSDLIVSQAGWTSEGGPLAAGAVHIISGGP